MPPDVTHTNGLCCDGGVVWVTDYLTQTTSAVQAEDILILVSFSLHSRYTLEHLFPVLALSLPSQLDRYTPSRKELTFSLIHSSLLPVSWPASTLLPRGGH